MALSSPSNDFGFTLIEVLMAMLILTVGLLGLLQSIQIAYEHNARNRVREAAVLLAEEQMNDFRVLAREPMNYFRSHPGQEKATTAKRVVGGLSRNFKVTRQMDRLGDLNRLRVAVHWAFRNETTRHEIYSFRK